MNSPVPAVNYGEHQAAMDVYMAQGEKRAMALGNRGPIRFIGQGVLHPDIIEAYWRCGFYVFEDVLRPDELPDIEADLKHMMSRFPKHKDADVDAEGRPSLALKHSAPKLFWSKPLGDPFGGTRAAAGRHPVKMIEPVAADDAPEQVVYLCLGTLEFSEAHLRVYGHPEILGVAQAINGSDFVPFNEAYFIKEPGLGPSVAWHQDGTTHWDAPDWDQDAHGFNFMAQLYPSTPGNGVWVLPGSHRLGRVDIRRLVAESGSEQIAGAVPLVCDSGDVIMTNRQLVHGSFANSSPDRRVTVNAGFFARNRVLDVTTELLSGEEVTFDRARVDERSRMIPIGIDARRQRFPDEQSYVYRPAVGLEDDNRWCEETRRSIVRDYNLRDMYI